MTSVVKLAMRAVQQLDWKIDGVNEALGLVTFQTGISWGSWSGISGSLNIEEIALGQFKVSGTGKQNIRGGQLIALNIASEAQGKARKVMEMMKQLIDAPAREESKRLKAESDKKQRHLRAVELCSEIKHKPLDFHSYQLLASEVGGRIEVRGLFTETFVFVRGGSDTKIGKHHRLHQWLIENITPLIERRE
jgi:hypothetical protein